ncbi:unnamed protein product [Meganyctiphanes norvegica]|uniref:Secreted protein n=1 Tax=Meganyctiphanes norvegica TaxID=48144 RepID=A0AAV2QI18_MEGNR
MISAIEKPRLLGGGSTLMSSSVTVCLTLSITFCSTKSSGTVGRISTSSNSSSSQLRTSTVSSSSSTIVGGVCGEEGVRKGEGTAVGVSWLCWALWTANVLF